MVVSHPPPFSSQHRWTLWALKANGIYLSNLAGRIWKENILSHTYFHVGGRTGKGRAPPHTFLTG